MPRVQVNTDDAERERTPPGSPDGVRISSRAVLRQTHRLGLRAFVAGTDLEYDLLALFENLVAAHVDRGVVNENVLSPPSTVMKP